MKKINLTLVNIWKFPMQTPHFGLTSLAAYVRQELPHINIKIIEGLNPYQQILKSRPDIIGFTSDTLVYNQTIKLACKLKKKTKIPFIIGGVHVTALPESLHPIFKLATIGEGELTLVEILKKFTNKTLSFKNLKKINGLAFYHYRKLILTPPRKLIKNINTLPFPARHLTPMNKYYLKNQLNLFGVKRLATVMTSRGCPYKCIFCGSPVQWKTIRFYSPERVVKEIKFLIKTYNIDGIMFWDDFFIAPQTRLKTLVRLIRKEKLHKKITFLGYARANLINLSTVKLLKSMNVKRLIYGLESGSPKILRKLKQNTVTIADNRRSIKLCRQYGIATSSGYITGTPGETLADLKKTYQFMKIHPLDNTQIYILTPYPGTAIWQTAIKQGLVSLNMDFDKLFVQLPPLSPLDFLKKNKPEIIKGRVFLNTKYKNNQEYLDLIFKMQKFAFWQNLKFYLRTAIQEPRLPLKLLTKKINPQ